MKLGNQCRAASNKEAVATEVSPSFSGKRNYAAALRGDGTDNIDKRYKLVLKSKFNESAEAMKKY